MRQSRGKIGGMANRRSLERKRRFLDALERGSSVGEAAAYAGVGRATVYRWRESDVAFGEDWDAAELVASGALRRRAYDLALGGNVRMLTFLLERADRKQGTEAGESVGAIEIVGLKEGESYAGDFIQFVEKGDGPEG